MLLVPGAVPQARGLHGMSTETCPLLTTPDCLAAAKPEASQDISKVALDDVMWLLPVPPFPGKEPRAFRFEAKELLI